MYSVRYQYGYPTITFIQLDNGQGNLEEEKATFIRNVIKDPLEANDFSPWLFYSNKFEQIRTGIKATYLIEDGYVTLRFYEIERLYEEWPDNMLTSSGYTVTKVPSNPDIYLFYNTGLTSKRFEIVVLFHPGQEGHLGATLNAYRNTLSGFFAINTFLGLTYQDLNQHLDIVIIEEWDRFKILYTFGSAMPIAEIDLHEQLLINYFEDLTIPLPFGIEGYFYSDKRYYIFYGSTPQDLDNFRNSFNLMLEENGWETRGDIKLSPDRSIEFYIHLVDETTRYFYIDFFRSR
jgi:hypothetical protein